jgi:hypothetical protein
MWLVTPQQAVLAKNPGTQAIQAGQQGFVLEFVGGRIIHRQTGLPGLGFTLGVM